MRDAYVEPRRSSRLLHLKVRWAFITMLVRLTHTEYWHRYLDNTWTAVDKEMHSYCASAVEVCIDMNSVAETTGFLVVSWQLLCYPRFEPLSVGVAAASPLIQGPRARGGYPSPRPTAWPSIVMCTNLP